MKMPVLALLGMLALAGPAKAQEALIGLTRAVAIVEHTLASNAFEAELETSDGRLVYEIDLVRGKAFHKALVDARTGKIVSVEKPRIEGIYRRWFDGNRLGRISRPLAPVLTLLESQAKGRVHEVGFELKRGRAFYEVEIETANGVAEIAIDAVSGERLAFALDD